MRVRLLTHNVWSLPWSISRDVPARMQAIAADFPRLEPDVAAFQEVWTAEAREALVRGGRRAGFEHIWHNRARLGGSGLLVLSRLPLRHAQFTPFRLNGLPERVFHGEYYSGKGFVRLSLETPEGPLSVVNTHLHAHYGERGTADDCLGHRAAQVVELAGALAGIREPVAVLGDFNIREGSPEYRALLGLTGLVDAAAVLGRRENTVRSENPYRSGAPGSGSRIDYVLARDGVGRAARPQSVRRVLDEPPASDGAAAYSDHAALLAEIDIASAPTAVPTPAPAALALAADLLAVGRRRAELRRGEQRLWAGTGAVASFATLATRRRAGASRRGLLRAALLGFPALGVASCAGIATLAERFVPRELRGYDAVEEILAALGRRAT